MFKWMCDADQIKHGLIIRTGVLTAPVYFLSISNIF